MTNTSKEAKRGKGEKCFVTWCTRFLLGLLVVVLVLYWYNQNMLPVYRGRQAQLGMGEASGFVLPTWAQICQESPESPVMLNR